MKNVQILRKSTTSK